jgi:hypothetical protein
MAFGRILGSIESATSGVSYRALINVSNRSKIRISLPFSRMESLGRIYFKFSETLLFNYSLLYELICFASEKRFFALTRTLTFDSEKLSIDLIMNPDILSNRSA